MDIKVQAGAAKIIGQIFDRRKPRTTVIDYVPQKPAFAYDKPVKQSFARSTPESEGISSSYIEAFLSELAADRSLDMHGVMVLRNGHVLSEAPFGAYDMSLWHATYSQAKSIVSLAIGMLIDEGRLNTDEKIVEIFDKETSKAAKLLLKNLTVKHLLTMSSGVLFNETGAVTDKNWLKGFLDSIPKGEPGKKFVYNSMNTYMLCEVVRAKSGMTVTEYLTPRLFEPLGIEDFFWEKSPTGLEKGGWGLYIKPEDLAKIGQLILDGGIWNGVRLISGEYLHEATTAHMHAPEEYGAHNYGYQIWVGRSQNVFLFNGMYGQNLIGFFDTGLMIVSNAGNDEFFQNCSFFDIVYKYFGPDFKPAASLPSAGTALKKLRLREDLLYKRSVPWWKKMHEKRAFAAFTASLNDRCYDFTVDEEAVTVSLLPLVTQAMQNDYGHGLDKICFYAKNGTPYIAFVEHDETYEFALLYGEASRASVSFHGETYEIACECSLTHNEDDVPVLKMRFSFLEIADTRHVKLFFEADGLRAAFKETPGTNYVLRSMETFTATALGHGVAEMLSEKFGSESLLGKVRGAFEPEVAGVQEKTAGIS